MSLGFVEGVRKMGDLYKSRLNNSLHHSSYRPGDRVVLEVRFPAGDKTYCYDADPGIYYPGPDFFEARRRDHENSRLFLPRAVGAAAAACA